METNENEDWYELLQISPNADPETIHRVYRLLARRFHPDNAQTGNTDRFRAITRAYEVLSNPEQRAQYDVGYLPHRPERWQVVSAEEDNDFEGEQLTRLAVLEVLYTQRRTNPNTNGASLLDLEQMTARPREHLEFPLWYLTQKQLVKRTDNSSFVITAAGVDDLERGAQGKRRRLTGRTAEPSEGPFAAGSRTARAT
jgi:curved DNA-binding protein CbpA